MRFRVVRWSTALRGRDEQGNAMVEFTWLALILMVPLVYILLAAFDVQRTAFGVSAASRAAGRAYALAPSESEGRARALQAAQVAMADQGVGAEDVATTTRCEPNGSACLSPGSTIVVTVTSQVVLPGAPAVFGGTPPAIRVSSTHRVPYGRYVGSGGGE